MFEETYNFSFSFTDWFAVVRVSYRYIIKKTPMGMLSDSAMVFLGHVRRVYKGPNQFFVGHYCSSLFKKQDHHSNAHINRIFQYPR